MKKYTHIKDMEDILDRYASGLKKLDEALDFLEKNEEDYAKLIEYYYSERYRDDLDDESSGLIDKNMKRGVLSEDAVYNLISDYYTASIRMLELGTRFFKRNV